MNNPNYSLLTYKEKKIVEIAKQRGYIFLADVDLIYASKTNGRNAMRRIGRLGFLEADREVMGKFIFVPYKEFEQKELEVKEWEKKL